MLITSHCTQWPHQQNVSSDVEYLTLHSVTPSTKRIIWCWVPHTALSDPINKTYHLMLSTSHGTVTPSTKHHMMLSTSHCTQWPHQQNISYDAEYLTLHSVIPSTKHIIWCWVPHTVHSNATDTVLSSTKYIIWRWVPHTTHTVTSVTKCIIWCWVPHARHSDVINKTHNMMLSTSHCT